MKVANQILRDQQAQLQEENSGEPLRFLSGDVVMRQDYRPTEKIGNPGRTDLLVVLEALDNHTCRVKKDEQEFNFPIAN